jgi:tetratricopeptide (TPR) repeat protein
LNDLATLAYARGDLDQAVDLFRRARETYEAVAPSGDTRLASILYNLAGVHLEQGEYAAAESLYRSALAIRERVLGPDDPITAEVWNDLGFLLLHQRKYDEAAGWLQKALGVWQESPGSGAYAAVALCNLALVRRLQGRYDVAESLYSHALVVEEQAFGPNHPERATTCMSLAALYHSRGNVERAVETYRKALALVEKALGAEDPLAIEIREQLKKLTGAPPRE